MKKKTMTNLGCFFFTLTLVWGFGWGIPLALGVNQSYLYPLSQAEAKLSNAMHAGTFLAIETELNASLALLAPLSGNVAVWYPTDETSLDALKAAIASIRDQCASYRLDGNLSMQSFQLDQVHQEINQTCNWINSLEQVFPEPYKTQFWLTVGGSIAWLLTAGICFNEGDDEEESPAYLTIYGVKQRLS
jgi:hypothetical protein